MFPIDFSVLLLPLDVIPEKIGPDGEGEDVRMEIDEADSFDERLVISGADQSFQPTFHGRFVGANEGQMALRENWTRVGGGGGGADEGGVSIIRRVVERGSEGE